MYHVITDEPGRLGPYDTIVTAFYNVANESLRDALGDRLADLRAIGDCVAPRTVLDAIREGEAVGRQL